MDAVRGRVGGRLVSGSLRSLESILNFQGSLERILYPKGLWFIPFLRETQGFSNKKVNHPMENCARELLLNPPFESHQCVNVLTSLQCGSSLLH